MSEEPEIAVAKNKSQFRKWLFWLLPVFVIAIACLIGTVYLKEYLADRNISYKNLSIGTKTIRVEGFNWEIEPSNDISFESINISWDWKVLFSSKENESMTEQLIRSVNGLDLHNLKYYSSTEKDSMHIAISRLNVQGIDTGPEYFADSINIDRLQVYQNTFQASDSTNTSPDLDSILDSLLDIRVNRLSISDSDIELIQLEQEYKVRDLHMGIEDLNTHNLMSVKMDTVYFLYADTLEISGGLEKGLIDENLVAWLNNLDIDTEGISINANAEYLLDETETSIHLNLYPSYVTLGWVRTFYPPIDKYLNPSLPASTIINLYGAVSIGSSEVDLEFLHVNLLSTDIEGSGFHNWSGDYGLFDWSLSKFTSSRDELLRLLPENYTPDFLLWPEKLNINAEYKGEQGIWDIKIGVESTSGVISANSSLDMKSEKFGFSKLEFTMADFYPDQVLTDIKTGLQNINLTAEADAPTLDDLVGSLKIESVNYKEELYENISAKFKRLDGTDSIYLHVDDSWLDASIITALHIADTSEIKFDSKVKLIPDRLGLDSLISTGYSSASGLIRFSGSDYIDSSVLFDSLYILQLDSSDYSIADIQLDYTKEDMKDYGRIELPEGQFVEIVLNQIPDRFDPESINEAIESMELEFWLTDKFSTTISGESNIDILLDSLIISKKENKWTANIDIPSLSYSDYRIENLHYSFSDSLSGGELHIQQVVGLPVPVNQVVVDHDWFDVHNLHLGVRAIINETDSLFIPINGRFRENGIFFGIEKNANIRFSEFSLSATEESGIYFNSSYKPEILNLFVVAKDNEESLGRIKARIDLKNTKNISIVEWHDLDFSKIPSRLLNTGDAKLTGLSTSKFLFPVENPRLISGQINFENVSYFEPGIKTKLALENNSIQLNNGKALIKDFTILDNENDSLIINTELDFKDSIFYSGSIHAQAFKLISTPLGDGDLSGTLEIDNDMSFMGDTSKMELSGTLNVLPSSSILYKLHSNLSLIDPNEIIVFEDFSDTTQAVNIPATAPKFDLIWDVAFNLDGLGAEVLFSEETQEFARLSLSGNLSLRTDPASLVPFAFGKISGEKGRAFYSPGGVPDLNLIVESTNVVFNGLLTNPSISFSGYETMIVDARSLSPKFADRGLEAFNIEVNLAENTIDNLDVSFSISAEDERINNYLMTFTDDILSQFAFNLLTFGKFRVQDKKISTYKLIANKLTELSHRNIKNADLYFTSDTRKEDFDGSIVGNLNYNFGKSFMQDRLLFTVDGTLQTAKTDDFEHEAGHWIDDLEIDYRLRYKPDVSIRGSRKVKYYSAVDGEVMETAIGLHIRQSFRKLFTGKK